MRYAANTSVAPERSRQEIESLRMKFGAEEFGYMTRRDRAAIGFVCRNLRFELTVPLPDRDDPAFCTTPGGRKKRSKDAAFREWEKEVRRRWRSLCLVIKALLVGVNDGVLEFERAFMPYIVFPNGHTLGDMALPGIQRAIESGQMPGSLKMLEALDQ